MIRRRDSCPDVSPLLLTLAPTSARLRTLKKGSMVPIDFQISPVPEFNAAWLPFRFVGILYASFYALDLKSVKPGLHSLFPIDGVSPHAWFGAGVPCSPGSR
ncbi:hypothetical protein BDW72DRAFT_75367 [Aspergillus terricola var. indicus]